MISNEPTTKEEEDEWFSFPHIAKALDNVHKLPNCAEPKPDTFLRTANMN